MSYISKRNNNSTIFVLIAISIVVVFLIFLFNKTVSSELNKATLERVNSVVEQQQLIIELAVEDAKNNLQILTKSISKEHNNKDIQGYLDFQLKDLSFEDLFFVNITNKKIINDNEFIKKTITNNSLTISLAKNSTPDNTNLNLANPVYFNNELKGILVAKYSLKKLITQLKEVINEKGYVMIVDCKGDPFFSSSSKYFSLKQLEEGKIEVLSDKSFNDIKNDHLNKVGDSINFIFKDVNYIATYKPLNINDWIIVVIADSYKASKDLRNISYIVIVVSSFIFLSLVCFFVFTWYSKLKTIKKIEKLAYYDSLTNAPNLIKFKKDATKILKENPDKSFGIFKLDLRNFKAVNEMYGFEVGNELLKAMAKTGELIDKNYELSAYCRVSADQFLTLIDAEFVRNLENESINHNKFLKSLVPLLDDWHMETVFGRYFIEPNETNIDDIINKVSMAHSFAKTQKIKSIWDYDSSFRQQILTAARISNKMEDALVNCEYNIFLQPKFRLIDNKIVGAEALVRWIEPDGTIISPTIFIPVFETNGFIVHLDMYVLDSVCKSLKEWLRKSYECVTVSVNFSRFNINNPNFVEEIIQIVDKYDLPHEYIEIELTETSIVDESKEELLEELIDKLHFAGFKISIDDFGAGYSSLGFLKNYKVDTLKLDRSFFMNNKHEQRGKTVVEGVIKLANSLGMYVVAEGVEEKEQVDFLKSVNCQSAQGYFYAKPMPTKDFEKNYLKKIVNHDISLFHIK